VEISTIFRANEGGRYYSFLRDITERKRAEVALRESEARFRALVEQAGDAFELCTEDGRLIDVNTAACVQLGYSREEMLRLTVFDFTPPLTRERYRELFESPQLRPVETFESQHRRKDGTVFPIEVTRSLVVFGGRRHAFSLIRDITERKRLENLHLQAQKLESLGTLAGGIAHDFNNVLAAILGNVQLAAQDVGPGHTAAQSLEEIRKASVRASELVRRILAFARPRDSRMTAVDLHAVVQEALNLLRSTLPAGISLTKSFSDDVPAVLADAGQVHEAVVNLTTNAAYAIGAHGTIDYQLESIELSEGAAADTRRLRPGRYARLTVTDNGRGMDKTQIEHIFDAFYTTKPLGEGTGLGLSMVHSIMAGHDGAVTVRSTPGKGSSFSLYFPVAQEDEVRNAPEAQATYRGSPPLRVLYVDDEEALVSLARRLFSRFGHVFSGFCDPQAALEHFRSSPMDFDVVVTDFAMPKLSGFDLARSIRELRPELPVLMTSGYLSAEDEARARQLGIREIIAKPAGADEIARALARLFPREG